MAPGVKRRVNGGDEPSNNKRSKLQGRKPWKTSNRYEAKVLQAGDTGIWVTCAQRKEALCVTEVRELFNHFAEKVYDVDDDSTTQQKSSSAVDVADAIKAELKSIKEPEEKPLFTSIKIDAPCVLFFKTRHPVEPVSFVKAICEEAIRDPTTNNILRKWTRFVKRLTPVTVMARASEEGVEKAAKEVLPPHFHDESENYHKFAIRANLRSHNALRRDKIIQLITGVVGEGHRVDLEHYEKLILVEVYKNVCGVSVVDDSFERLKRFNIGEIFHPTPKDLPGNPRKQVRKEEDYEDEAEESKETTETNEIEGKGEAEGKDESAS